MQLYFRKHLNFQKNVTNFLHISDYYKQIKIVSVLIVNLKEGKVLNPRSCLVNTYEGKVKSSRPDMDIVLQSAKVYVPCPDALVIRSYDRSQIVLPRVG